MPILLLIDCFLRIYLRSHRSSVGIIDQLREGKGDGEGGRERESERERWRERDRVCEGEREGGVGREGNFSSCADSGLE